MWPHKYDENKTKDAENKIRNWCNRSRNYGIFGRLDCSVISIDNKSGSRKEQIKEHIEIEAKNQSSVTYRILARIFNFKNLDFQLYDRVIMKLKKEGNNEIVFDERLDIIKRILSQLKLGWLRRWRFICSKESSNE